MNLLTYLNRKNPASVCALVVFAFAPLATAAQIASSSNFTLEKALVSAGGGSSSGPTFSVDGSVGQNAAGPAAGAVFHLQGGFWSYNLAPTAAGLTVAGRVATPEGHGIRNAIVQLHDGSGDVLIIQTGSFGLYRFEGVQAGQTVILTVSSGRYTFTPRVLTLYEDIVDFDFVPAAPLGSPEP